MSTQSESTVKQRILITTLTLNPSTMAYRVFQNFIKHSAYYDGEMEIFPSIYKLAPTVQITLDYEDKYCDKMAEAIDIAKEVLFKGNVQPLEDLPTDSKYFAYESMRDEAMDYIYGLLPYEFSRHSSEFLNNPVQASFNRWFFDLPLGTDLDKLADECVNKYMDLLLRYVVSGKAEGVNWKPDFN